MSRRPSQARFQTPLTILNSSLIYFALVFTTGFALGMIRVPFIQPLLGDRRAQLLEMFFMLVAIIKSAQTIVGRLHPQTPTSQLVMVGIGGLYFMVMAEVVMAVYIMGKEWNGWKNWMTDRDAVAGPVYFAMLAVFAAIPAWIHGI